MKNPEKFEDQMKRQLDESIESLPDSVTRALQASREKALQAASTQPKLQSWQKPIWAMAATICLVVPLWYGLPGTEPEPNSPLLTKSTNLDALELMSTMAELNEEDMELVENLDFALWLIEQQALPANG